MGLYVNYLDEKYDVSQEILSKECEEIFGNISSLEGYRTKINDANKNSLIVYPIIFIIGIIFIIVANLFLLKQGENLIFNMIMIPLILVLFGAWIFSFIIYMKNKVHLDDFYIERRNLNVKVFIKNKKKIFVYSNILFSGKIGEMILYNNGVKKIISSNSNRVTAFNNYYVESIYLIEKFFTECKNAKYRKAIKVENENALIVFNNYELILKNNILNKMILSYDEAANINTIAVFGRHIFMNIKTINGNAKPLHFQNLN